MEEELDIILSAVDNATDTFESVSEAAEEMGQSMQDSAESGSSGFEEVEESASGAEDPISQISSLLEGMVGIEVFSTLADALWDVADKAGTFEDSLMRARLEAEGAGIDVNDMTDAVSELSATTGRAGSEIRESFINATARGITDLDSFKQMMTGAGAQATLFGTDIESMADKFSSMAMRSTLMERSLASTGITMEELADAMGMTGATADEVKAKWQELDTNQRAAILGQAASMNEGENANEEYKKSWAGLQAQIDIAKGRIERLVGEVLLPVLVPALQVAARVLNWLGDTISSVMDGPFGGLISVIGSAAAAFALAVPAYMAVQAAITLLTASAIPAATALWGMVAPLLPFIAIGAAIVLVIYEVGKAFGWWTDASSMIDAIGAGLQRLWSAFINHPDVQAFIQGLTEAWSVFSKAVGDAWNALMEFFGVTDSGDFDVIRALIDGIGLAWQGVTLPIRTLITLFTGLINVGRSVLSGQTNLVTGILQAWTLLRTTWMALLGNIVKAIASWAKNIIKRAINAGKEFVKRIIDNIKQLPAKFLSILVRITQYIALQVVNWVRRARDGARDLVIRVINYISQLPGRVYDYLVKVSQYVAAQVSIWVRRARDGAHKLLTSVINYIKQLPGKVYDYMVQVANKITSGAANWAKNAKEKAKGIVTAVTDTLTGLPGKVYQKMLAIGDSLTKAGSALYNKAKNVGQSIYNGIMSAVSGGGGGGQAAGFDYLGMMAEMKKKQKSYTLNDNTSMSLDHNINLSLDLKNVPSHMSERELANLITNRKVISSLVNSSDFQVLDGKVKKKIALKGNRARGV